MTKKNNFHLVDAVNNHLDHLEIILRINRICNQKCFFCFAEIDNKTDFTYQEVVNEIESIIKNYTDKKLSFIITGGEPTINKDFIKILDYLYNKAYSIQIQTNAVYFGNFTNFNKVKPYLDKVDMFISYHSHTEKIYNYITGSKGQFQLATQGIKNLIQVNELELNIVVNRFNLPFMELYFLFLGKNFSGLGVFHLNISILASIAKYENQEKMLIKYSDLVKKINNSEKIIKKFDIQITPSFGSPCEIPFCLGKDLFYFEDNIHSNAHLYQDRTKLNSCKKCKYNDNCNGVLKIYIDKYGADELIPIES